MRVLLAPRALAAHAVLLLALAGAVLLSNWQFGVWSSSRADAARDPAALPVVALDSLLKPGGVFRGSADGRRVSVAGAWIDADTFFVSSRKSVAGANGYWVVTPIRTSAGELPVVRGWSATASATPAAGPANVVGLLQPSDDDGPASADARVLAGVSIPRVAQFVSAPLYPGYVVADAPVGLDAAAPPTHHKSEGWAAGLRNFLYAIQWWLFGGLAVFIWWRWCRDEMRDAGGGQVASPS